MSKLDDATRAHVALGWEQSGLDQATYAAQNGIQPRTLRAWRHEFCHERQPVEQPVPTSEPVAAALQVFDERLGGLEKALVEVRAAVAKCQAAVDAAPACRPVSTGMGAADAYKDEHQAAGGTPVMELAEVQGVVAAVVENDVQVVAEPVVNEPAADQAQPVTPRKRKGKRSIFFDDLGPPPDAETPTTLADAVQQPVAAVEHGAVPEGPAVVDTPVEHEIRPAAFPNAAWGRYFLCPI